MTILTLHQAKRTVNVQDYFLSQNQTRLCEIQSQRQKRILFFSTSNLVCTTKKKETLHSRVKQLGPSPPMSYTTKNIVVFDLCICWCQLDRHETLSIMEEMYMFPI